MAVGFCCCWLNSQLHTHAPAHSDSGYPSGTGQGEQRDQPDEEIYLNRAHAVKEGCFEALLALLQHLWSVDSDLGMPVVASASLAEDSSKPADTVTVVALDLLLLVLREQRDQSDTQTLTHVHGSRPPARPPALPPLGPPRPGHRAACLRNLQTLLLGSTLRQSRTLQTTALEGGWCGQWFSRGPRLHCLKIPQQGTSQQLSPFLHHSN